MSSSSPTTQESLRMALMVHVPPEQKESAERQAAAKALAR